MTKPSSPSSVGDPPSGPIGNFLADHFRHFNARELRQAADAYVDFVEAGGMMMVTLAGAMSTAELGRSLAPMIRAGKVHAICCTAANLEEDLFMLAAGDDYETIANWRALSVDDEVALRERGMNRVTDVCIPETVMRDIEGKLTQLWSDAAKQGTSHMPCEFLFELLEDPSILQTFDRDLSTSWVAAAKEVGIPIYTPGFEDSTLGNIFTARVIDGTVASHRAYLSGTEQMQRLASWYEDQGQTPVGFFQIGGGIAGDFPICVVPMLIQDLRKSIPYWQYFCQISDAVTSYGGYSGAVPNEKITWCKLDRDTPKFMIQSDATIVAPLMFARILGW